MRFGRGARVGLRDRERACRWRCAIFVPKSPLSSPSPHPAALNVGSSPPVPRRSTPVRSPQTSSPASSLSPPHCFPPSHCFPCTPSKFELRSLNFEASHFEFRSSNLRHLVVVIVVLVRRRRRRRHSSSSIVVVAGHRRRRGPRRRRRGRRRPRCRRRRCRETPHVGRAEKGVRRNEHGGGRRED